MFRTVPPLMHLLTDKATLDEFDLLTLVAEIERIINDRPITKLPSSPDDVATLTPSMIISRSVGDSLPPDVFMKSDGYRHSWRRTQYLADIFWEKWLSHYLPLLKPRKKWFATSSNKQLDNIVLLVDENFKFCFRDVYYQLSKSLYHYTCNCYLPLNI